MIDKTKNGENEPSLEVAEVVLAQYNLVNNQYQQTSQVLYSFTPNNIVDNQYQQKSEVLFSFTCNKSHGNLLNVEPNNLVFLKTYNTDFHDITIRTTEQNGRPLEIENKDNLTLLSNK